MKPLRPGRPPALPAALVLTLAVCAAVWLRGSGEEEDVEVVAAPRAARASRTSEPAPVPAAADMALPSRGPWPVAPPAALAAWSAPAAPAAAAAATPGPAAAPATQATAPAAVAPAPPPQAPPLGYELMGTVLERGGSLPGALLAGVQNSLWVRAGDRIGVDWRVQRIAADHVELLWLPQQLPLTLSYRTP